MKKLLRPDERWGPAVDRYRQEYEASKDSMSSNNPICISYRTDIVSVASLKDEPEAVNLVI